MRKERRCGWGVWRLALALTALAGPAAAAERPWVEVKTPHFTVVSNAGEGTARNVGWQFEQARAALRALWPWAREEAGRPFLVLAVRDQRSLGELAPEWAKGPDGSTAVFVSGAAASYVALRTDVRGGNSRSVNPWKTAFEGYADNVLVRNFEAPLPPWYREGMREVFGNTLVRDKDIQLGRLIPWHLQELNRGTRLTLPRLFAMTRQDPHYTSVEGRRMFAAQSWAFVHYLLFGDKGAHQEKFGRLAALLRAGHADAVATALGDVAALASGFARYHERSLYQYAQVNTDVDVAREKFPVRTLTAAESEAVRAGLHAAMGHADAARTLAASARTASPDLAAPYEAEGVVADRAGDADGARAAFAQAAAKGSTNPYVHLRLAQLTWRAPGDKDWKAIAALYARAAELASGSAEALRWQSEALSQAGQYTDAEAVARRAIATEPDEAGPRLALFGALAGARRLGEAEAALREAGARVGTPREREEVAEAARWLQGARGQP